MATAINQSEHYTVLRSFTSLRHLYGISAFNCSSLVTRALSLDSRRTQWNYFETLYICRAANWAFNKDYLTWFDTIITNKALLCEFTATLRQMAWKSTNTAWKTVQVKDKTYCRENLWWYISENMLIIQKPFWWKNMENTSLNCKLKNTKDAKFLAQKKEKSE